VRPGNAGGGKDPDFQRAFEDGEGKVIGDEPYNTGKDPDPSEKVRKAKEDSRRAEDACGQSFSPCASR
jgi:hypothetical protein